MRLPAPKPRRQAENTIALINVVFLMLIFFLVAGTVAPPIDAAVSPIETAEAESTAPPEALSVRGDGTLRFRGRPVTLEEWAAGEIAAAAREDGSAPNLLVDRDLPAPHLVAIVAQLRALGFERVSIITERSAQ